jgi:2-phosphosulfolactate phosphatase
MYIDAFLTPCFPDKEDRFKNSLVVMIDVLRAGTTICAALYNGAKEIIPNESVEKAVKIYSGLSKESRFLGGERNGKKLSGFHAGNSPLEYSRDIIENKTIIFTTTNGTSTFLKAKDAVERIIGSFVNINATLDFLTYFIHDFGQENLNITFLCSGTNGRLSYEDTACAGAYIDLISKNFMDSKMTDTALAAMQIYKQHETDLHEYLSDREHARFLKSIGYDQDIKIALNYDIFPVVPIIQGNSITPFSL